MSRTTLGVALFHRTPLARIIQRLEPQLTTLLDALHACAPTLRYHGAKPTLPALLDALAQPDTRVSLESPDNHHILVLRDAADDIPSRATAPRAIRAVLPEAHSHALLEPLFSLADTLDADYGFHLTTPTPAAAFDEVFWPLPGQRRATPHDRTHNDAWLHLMRSLGRLELGDGLIPDLYPGNLFGSRIVNAIRDRPGVWETLEDTLQLRYLDGGTVLFDLPPKHHTTTTDLLLPHLLMGRILAHAREGNPLLLDTLANTGDLRLLPGLAFEDGLHAFQTLLPTDVDPPDNLDDARAWLRSSQHTRPRGYGEPPRESAPETTATPEPLTSPTPQTSPTPPPTATTPQTPAPPAASPNAVWQLHALHPSSLRVQLTESHDQPPVLTLNNTLQLPITLHHLSAIHTSGDALQSLTHAPLPEDPFSLAPRTPTELSITLPQSHAGEHLRIDATFTAHLRAPLLDLDAWSTRRPSNARPWPAEIQAVRHGQHLHVALTNTALEALASWRLWLDSTDDGTQDDTATHSHAPLSPGQTAYVTLHLPDAPSGPLAVWLDAELAHAATLLEFTAA